MGYEITYFIYLLASIALTVIVGNHLHKNGGVWIESLIADKLLASKINDVLLLLYRLLNVGYIIFTLMMAKSPVDMATSISFLTTRLSIIIIGLAYLHYQNIIGIYIFSQSKFSHHV